jgi:hypothetical protein
MRTCIRLSRKIRGIDETTYVDSSPRCFTTALQEPRLIDGLGNPSIIRYNTVDQSNYGLRDSLDKRFCGVFPLSLDSSTTARVFSTNTETNAVDNIADQLQYYGKKKQTLVSLKALMETGVGALLHHHPEGAGGNSSETATHNNELLEKVRIQVACFLHRELPVRLARKSIDDLITHSD